MKTTKIIMFIATAIMLLASSACGPAAVTATATTDPNQVNVQNTSIAETAQNAVDATLTQIVLSQPSDTPAPTFTETLTQIPTLAPTATSSLPMIVVSEATNCRSGPGIVYDRLGQLQPGVMTEVFGLDPSKSYYYIENPNKPGTYCWVWGYYATTSSDFSGLPVYTPGPTPIPTKTATPSGTKTPTATATYTTSGACSTVSLSPVNNSQYTPGQLYVDLVWTVKNTSLLTWDDATVLFKFMSGTNLHNVSTSSLTGGDVASNGTTTLLLDMIIPNTVGTYTESWAVVQSTTSFCSMTLTIKVAN